MCKGHGSQTELNEHVMGVLRLAAVIAGNLRAQQRRGMRSSPAHQTPTVPEDAREPRTHGRCNWFKAAHPTPLTPCERDVIFLFRATTAGRICINNYAIRAARRDGGRGGGGVVNGRSVHNAPHRGRCAHINPLALARIKHNAAETRTMPPSPPLFALFTRPQTGIYAR